MGSNFAGACADCCSSSYWLDDSDLGSATIICNTNNPADLTAAKFLSDGSIAVDWDGSAIVDQAPC